MTSDPPSPAGMRRDYTERGALLETDLAADWPAQFARWFADAAAAGLPEPNAMIVATADADGPAQRPDRAAQGVRRARLRLLHQLRVPQGRRGARQPVREPGLPLVPDAAAGDGRRARWRGWPGPRPRSTSPPGRAAPSSAPGRARSRRCCRTGPRSRPGWPRAVERFGDEAVPAPPHWGGLRVVPETVEFWQGRTSRLHDRLRFRRARTRAGSSSGWLRESGAGRAAEKVVERKRWVIDIRPLRGVAVPADVDRQRRLLLRLPVHRGGRAGARCTRSPARRPGSACSASPAWSRC